MSVIKSCSKCGEGKPLSHFSKCSKEKLGVRSRCKVCTSIDGAKYRVDNLDKERARSADYHRRNPNAANLRNREWRAKNVERARARDNEWGKKNRDKIAAVAKRHYQKKRESLQFRIQAAIKASINTKIKSGKGGQKTFSILGYSFEDLRQHLERKFLPGMSWDNWGFYGWHIDHEIPLAAFNYASVHHIDFKRAWALSNLKPMWASDNKSKGAKLMEPFQPSLAI